MVKTAWLSFIMFGLVIGASSMYAIMYNEPLSDYSYQGIISYTSVLYSLGDSIFGTITGNMMIVAMEIIELITIIVDVITNIFGWLANQLGNIINGVVAFLESLGIDLSQPEPPTGCVIVNGRLECF
jgi:hypothetical protein